jgi:wyosine [tRNA(Phe)-imidazoG37] synthetase (radical SAM superfamily)
MSGVRMQVLKLQQGVIYGPINSRRLGRSLGINLLPTDKKVCSFDCIYCHYGRTKIKTLDPTDMEFPSKDKILSAIEGTLRKFRNFDYITFSGNGEPTLHPQFTSIVDETIPLRDKYCLDKPIAILSNSSTLYKKEIRDVIEKLDVRILKLDAGCEDTFQKINKPYDGVVLNDIIGGIKALNKPMVQCVMIDGKVQNVNGEPFDNLIDAFSEVKPREIQIYSTDRPVPVKGVKKIPRNKLVNLAMDIKERTEIHVTSY